MTRRRVPPISTAQADAGRRPREHGRKLQKSSVGPQSFRIGWKLSLFVADTDRPTVDVDVDDPDIINPDGTKNQIAPDFFQESS
jgi:hypothetical protein